MTMNGKMVSFSFFSEFLIFLAFFSLCGCAPLVTSTKSFFSPSVSLRELSLDNATDLPAQSEALEYSIKRLNTTQYGIVLDDTGHKGAKPFDYTELYVKLQEKVTQDIWNENIKYNFWRRDTLYIVEIASYCAGLDRQAGLPDTYAKTYSFTSLEEAHRICSGLIALGAKPCSTGSSE
ncbi:MAG: hypothetical protein WCQ99_05660 [Pseudomonadota bacterium]